MNITRWEEKISQVGKHVTQARQARGINYGGMWSEQERKRKYANETINVD